MGKEKSPQLINGRGDFWLLELVGRKDIIYPYGEAVGSYSVHFIPFVFSCWFIVCLCVF